MKEKIDFSGIKAYSKNVYIGEFKNCARFVNDKLEIPDKNQLDFVYILYNETDDPYIIKCPVIKSNNISYEVYIKNRPRRMVNDSIRALGYESYKIKKKDIDCCIYTSSTYDLALVRLLQFEKDRILLELEKTNDPDLYRLYIQASQRDLFFGLEFIARKLKMDYIFKLEEDSLEDNAE